MDREQTRGTGPGAADAFVDGVRWALIGAVVGALIALPLAFVVLADLEVWARALIVAAAGAAGGATVGFTLAAGRSDDDADNGLGVPDAQAEEDAAFRDHPDHARTVGLPGSDTERRADR